MACAWLSLLPQGLCVVYVALIYSTREVEIGLTFAGQLACEALNWALKRYFKQARPQVIHALHKGYGMPSSHAQFVSYFAVSVTLFLLLRHSPSIRVVEQSNGAAKPGLKGHRARSRSEVVVVNGVEKTLNPEEDETGTPISPAYRLQLHYPRLTHSILSLAAICAAALIAWSRVYLQYHTVKQVLVGCATGATFAVMWFSATEWARRRGLLEWVLELDLVRSARIRDLICEEDLVEVGWQVWEEKRRQRGRTRANAKKGR